MLSGGEVSGDDGWSASDVDVISAVGRRPPRPTADKLACSRPDEPPSFRLYSLGPGFAGLPLETVLVTCSNPQPVPGDAPGVPDSWRTNTVSYVYGSCEPTGGEGGCAPPLEIQIAPACERHAAREWRPRGLTARRGVPSSADLGQVVLYTADSIVTIFALDASELLDRAVASLRPLRAGAAPADLPPPLAPAGALPPPLPGALDGGLTCVEAAARHA